MCKLKLKNSLVLLLSLSFLVSICHTNEDHTIDILRRKTARMIMHNMMSQLSSPLEIFKVWHFLHNKQYSLESEEGKEKTANFIKNFEIVKKHNSQFEKNYSLGLNHFADLTLDEFHSKYLKHNAKLFAEINGKGFLSSFVRGGRLRMISEQVKDGDDFENINWSEKAMLAKVYDQGTCGSCWAFSSVQAVEALYAITNKKKITLSKQQLVDCEKESNGCQGGYMHTSMDYVKKVGLLKEEEYPYRQVSDSCKVDELKNPKSETVKIGGWEQCYEDEKCSTDVQLYRTLKKGPVSSVVDASEEFMLYDGGVYDKPCNQYNHAILVTGYGKKDHEGEDDYWIIKNSWGVMWGDHGYMKIKHASNYNSCLLNKYFVRPFY